MSGSASRLRAEISFMGKVRVVFFILNEVSGKITSHSGEQYLYFVESYAKTEMRKTGACSATCSGGWTPHPVIVV